MTTVGDNSEQTRIPGQPHRQERAPTANVVRTVRHTDPADLFFVQIYEQLEESIWKVVGSAPDQQSQNTRSALSSDQPQKKGKAPMTGTFGESATQQPPRYSATEVSRESLIGD